MFKVKALYEYASGHEDDLAFPVGQIITVTDEEDADWYGGEYIDDAGQKQEGIFPRNFVEKFEPTAPPRPTRTRPRKETEPAAAPPDAPAASSSPLSPRLPEPQEAEGSKAFPPTPIAAAPPPVPQAAPEPPPSAQLENPDTTAPAVPPPAPKPADHPAAAAAASSPPPKPAPAAQPKSTRPPPPPAAGEQGPGPGSFRDRIAAFNKPAAPPIAPFKPSGLGSGGSGGSGFIKKPFVAPPPSRNAYVPPTRDVSATKVYRRDEDPEIKEREAENQATAEKAGLVPGANPEAEAGDDQPKPMSLKERLALLQKQQMEAAQRHADAVTKKEKPKRPPKKRAEGQEGTEEGEPLQSPPLERRDTGDTSRKQSLDETAPPRFPPAHRRKPSKGPEPRDGNEADMSGAGDTTEDQEEDLTEREDGEEKHKVARAKKQDDKDDEEEEVDEEDEEQEEEDYDPEVRRKEELRARMARIAGGMTGMAGIFGGPVPGAAGPAPQRRKKSGSEKPSEEAPESASPSGARAPPVPTMMALPGMYRAKSHEEKPQESPGQGVETEEEAESGTPLQETVAPFCEFPPSLLSTFLRFIFFSRSICEYPFMQSINVIYSTPEGAAGWSASDPRRSSCAASRSNRMYVSQNIVPTIEESLFSNCPAARPPPPPSSAVKSASEGSESGDELSEATNVASEVSRAPPPPPIAAAPTALPTSPKSPQHAKRGSSAGPLSPVSPTAAAPAPPINRNSRPPPPVPGMAPAIPPAQTRPPPPPPPGAPPSRSSTADDRPLSPVKPAHRGDEDNDEEVTEYEGDYDTDIASSVPHKDALKSHQRESSFEETISVKSPLSEVPPTLPPPPPIPSASAPRAGPPPVPSQPPPDNRKSTDMPHIAPPPPPPPKASSSEYEEYDPYNYSPSGGVPPMPAYSQPPPPPRRSEEPYSPVTQYLGGPDRRAPPASAIPSRTHRTSLDVGRAGAANRRSADLTRPSTESGFVANEIDLSSQSGWWLQPNSLPPQLQGRKDIFYESEESTSTSARHGGKTTITRDIYVLFQDYSQTVITVQFDPQDKSDVRLEQRHESPPRTLRQDQLEQSYERFGRAIGDAAAGKRDTVVGDGSPQALVVELLRPHKDALLPVGSRAYGALVYSNLANASTTQNDEIRRGDIISIRNAKFQGKHGAMHAKYNMEVGKPDHVAVVAEWDGTKKKVRAWEQGRGSKKVKIESFKLDDLRSGEVKIWRVMPRSWVGWEGGN